jgi:predicted lactoylglutathione lyase
MPKLIFVNLPVADLGRSTSFYEAMGGTKNEKFSDDTGSCIVLSDTIFVMLLSHAKYRTFESREIADAQKTSQVLLALSEDSRAAVDGVVDKAAAAGGRADPNPAQDHGFMYGRSYADPDGHTWEVFWMDPAVAASS